MKTQCFVSNLDIPVVAFSSCGCVGIQIIDDLKIIMNLANICYIVCKNHYYRISPKTYTTEHILAVF